MAEFTKLTGAELVEMLNGLLESWRDHPAETTPRHKEVSVAQLATTFALAAHTHRLASAVRVLREAGHHLEAMPLVRAAVEHALTAQYIAQYPDGVLGFLNEHARNRRNMFETISKTGWEGATDIADQLDQWEHVDTPATVAARSFKQLCADLEPAGHQAYAMYRFMSSFSHAGGTITDEYIRGEPPRLFKEPSDFGKSELWLYLACASTVWAGRAVDVLEKGSPRRRELRLAAGQLGIKPELQLSWAFHQRIQKAKQEQRSKRDKAESIKPRR